MNVQSSQQPRAPLYPARPHRASAVPDLRFEYSYIRSIAPYVLIERRSDPSTPWDPKGKGKEVESSQDSGAITVVASENIRVQWGQVIWITCRDQVISPFLQGLLWYACQLYDSTHVVSACVYFFRGVASQYLRPAMMAISRWWERGSSRERGSAKIDGGGIQWLKRWFGNLKVESAGTGARANLAL